MFYFIISNPEKQSDIKKQSWESFIEGKFLFWELSLENYVVHC